MKLFLISLVPAVTMAFSGPEATSFVLDQHIHTRGGELALKSTLDDTATSAVETTEKYVAKADDLVVGRLLRVVDHAPAFFTLKALADAAGVKLGLTPDSISALCTGGCDMGGVTTALDTPDFMSATVCKVYILSQMLSLAKSALASDGNELSQADITAVAVSLVVFLLNINEHILLCSHLMYLHHVNMYPSPTTLGCQLCGNTCHWFVQSTS